MKTVTQSYLDGIRDERAFMRQLQAAGENVASMAPDILANIESTLRRGFAGEAAEHLRGGRDFWRNQIRKGLRS